MEDVSGDGKVPVERERLTILQVIGEIEKDMSLSRLNCWKRVKVTIRISAFSY